MLAEKNQGNSRLLNVLYAEGGIKNGSIDELKKEADSLGKTYAEYLLEKNIVTEEKLTEAISKAYNIPYIKLDDAEFQRDALEFIKEEDAKANTVIPFAFEDDKLKIAIFDLDIIQRKDPKFFERLRKSSKRKIDLYIAEPSAIKHYLKYYQKDKNTKMVRPALQKNDDEVIKREKDILDVLVTQDMIDFKEAKKIRDESEKKNIKIEDLLSEKGKVSEEELAKAYSALYNLPFIRLDANIPAEIVTKFPEEVSRKYRVIVFDMMGERVIKVATSRPFDPKIDELLNFVADKNELEVDRFVTTDGDIEEALKVYQNNPPPAPEMKPIAQEIPQESPSKQPADEKLERRELPVAEADIGRLLKEDIKNLDALEDIIKKGSVPTMVAAIINFALFRRASDVHIQPAQRNLRVRYRIDGVLNDITFIPLDFHLAIISRIKILSKLRIDEKRIPQDGRFEVNFGEKSVDIRVSTLPTTHGEKVVMRLLDTSSGTFSLDDLGLRGKGFKEFVRAITKPYGMIIACGPTGSGKTTTLYAALNYINKPGVNIVTLEDPVEYEIDGISQSQAKPDIGYDFADGLRSVLRQDPDIIMVGEIRDKETAGMAVQSSLTGHLVFSSLHTNDSSGGIPRLINMGIEPFLIISAVNIFIAQRLVRKICPNCKKEARLPSTLLAKIEAQIDELPRDITSKFKKPYKFFEGGGCRSCSEGYFGRIGIFEVMPMTERIQKMSMASPTAITLKQTAVEEGMLTMKQDGLIKALEGITTIEEVLRVTIS